MKIKRWEDLNGVKNGEYEIEINSHNGCKRFQAIEIRRAKDSFYVSEIRYTQAPTETVLAFLKLFGFDVELEKPPVLTWREWCLCNAYPDYWIAKDLDGQICMYEAKPYRDKSFWNISDDCFSAVILAELFQWLKWEDEPISTKEMLKWEHEEQKCAFDE